MSDKSVWKRLLGVERIVIEDWDLEDGDRTLVREDSPQAMLNDKPADFYWSGDGRFLCQSNPDTGNKFCASHDDDESDEG